MPTATTWRNRIVAHGTEAPEQLLANPRNFRIHPKNQQDALSGVLNEIGWIQSVIVNERTGFVIDGHLRVALAISHREPEIPVVYVDLSDEEEALALASIDPISAMAATDKELLDSLLRDVSSADAGVQQMLSDLAEKNGLHFDGDQSEIAELGSEEPASPSRTLADRFGIPPFSVLDARQGYWQERKRGWLALGIQSELGRGDTSGTSARARPGEAPTYRQIGTNGLLGFSEQARSHYRNAAPGGSPRPATRLGADGKTIRGDGHGRGLARTNGQDLMRGEHVVGEGEQSAEPQSGTSIFDPVLCEIAYRWFCPPDGAVLDPFAGGSVRGIVASKLGRAYTGIELRGEQIAANSAQAERITPELPPRWIQGDSMEIASLAGGQMYDLFFTCPPYGDLERYSDDPADLSVMPFADFLASYRAIIARSVALLADNRFACIVVGDYRDPKGFYRNFVSETIAAFEVAGARLYNEAILVTALGSLPIRVGRQFESARKLGKTHQQFLVFCKGDPKKATEAVGPVEFGEILDSTQDVGAAGDAELFPA